MQRRFTPELLNYSRTLNEYALKRNREENATIIGEGVITIPADGFQGMSIQQSLAEVEYVMDIAVKEAEEWQRALQEEEKWKQTVLEGYGKACREEYGLFGYTYDPSIDDHEKNFDREVPVRHVREQCRDRAQQMRRAAVSDGCDEAFEAVGVTLSFDDYKEHEKYLLQNGMVDPKEYCTKRAIEQQGAELQRKCIGYFSRHEVTFDDRARARIAQLVSEEGMGILDACKRVAKDHTTTPDEPPEEDFRRKRTMNLIKQVGGEAAKLAQAKAHAKAQARAQAAKEKAERQAREELIHQAALRDFIDGKDIAVKYALDNRHVDEALARSILGIRFDADYPTESVQKLDEMLRQLKLKVDAAIKASEEGTGESLEDELRRALGSNDIGTATEIAITAHRLHEEGGLSEEAVLDIGDIIGEMADEPETAGKIVEDTLYAVQGEVRGFAGGVFNSLKNVKEAQLMNSKGVRDICKLAKQYPQGHHLGFMAWIRNQRPETTQEEFAIALKCFDEDYSKVDRITKIRQRLLQNPYVSEESRRRMTWWVRFTAAVKSFFRQLLAPFRSQYHGHHRRRTPRRS